MERATLEDLDAAPHARPFDDGEPSVVSLSLGAGEGVAPHSHPDRQVVLFVRTGTLELELDGETHTLEAGEVVRFDGQREVAPTATTEAHALIVLAPRPD